MKIKCFTLLLVFAFAFSQDDDIEGIELDAINVNVEVDRPRVAITLTRKRPEFPEIPIKRSFYDEIMDKYKNSYYKIERRKKIIFADIEKEVNKLN